MEYVRCYYCDSGITINQLEIKDREKTGICHDICTWHCPCCNMMNFSHIFAEEDCTYCGGDGEIRILKEPVGDKTPILMSESVVCTHCDGTGYDGFDRSYPPNNYICDKCDGTGRIDNES